MIRKIFLFCSCWELRALSSLTQSLPLKNTFMMTVIQEYGDVCCVVCVVYLLVGVLVQICAYVLVNWHA